MPSSSWNDDTIHLNSVKKKIFVVVDQMTKCGLDLTGGQDEWT